jgi:uncharacterized membrane protein
MANRYMYPAPSTAAIAGHPLHPATIPFPIAFLVGALATDLVYWITRAAFWAEFSVWLVRAGLLMGAIAAVLGLIDFLTVERARKHSAGWIHLIGNLVAMIIATISLPVRWGDPVAAVLPVGLILSVITGTVLGVTGWFGGELVFRHLIGVTGPSNQQS